METIEYRTVDKALWGDGPWQIEPDKKQWEHKPTRLPCLIVRGPLGALCGYVGVPRGHPCYGIDYDHVDVDVHGGLTFANHCQEGAEERGICHKVGPGEPDDVWWLGFDCSHAGDFYPMANCLPISWSYPDANYKDLAYVEAEVGRLAEQLAAKAI